MPVFVMSSRPSKFSTSLDIEPVISPLSARKLLMVIVSLPLLPSTTTRPALPDAGEQATVEADGTVAAHDNAFGTFCAADKECVANDRLLVDDRGCEIEPRGS